MHIERQYVYNIANPLSSMILSSLNFAKIRKFTGFARGLGL